MNRRTLLAAALDVASILVFVAIGRREHDEGSAIGGIIATAAPFLIGLGVAWIAVRAWRRRADSILLGIVIWPTTVLVGMVVRNLVFGDGTAPSFVVVATLFTGMCLVGWRAVARSINRRGQSPGDRLTTR